MGGDDPNLRAAEILDLAKYYVAAFKITPRAAILMAADGEHRMREASDALRYWRARRQLVEEAFIDAIELAKRGFLD